MRSFWWPNGVALGLLSLAPAAIAKSSINLTPGVTPISHDIYKLHMTIFWICLVIGGLVFSVMIIAMVKHRKSKGHQPAQFKGNTAIEIAWIIIPTLILVIIAIPATIVLMRMYDEKQAAINIKITGYQWKWKYDYLDYGISYFSVLSTPRAQIEGKEPKGKWYLLEVDKPLVVPIHKKIRFLVTSNDVIHSWWVPALGVKRDAVPGFIHESWARIDKPGTYRGQCAELCGKHHAYMPIVVVAKTEDDFKKWVAQRTQKKPPSEEDTLTDKTKEALMAQGKKVYQRYCSVCHRDDGAGQPPVFPAIKGGKITTGPVKAHVDIVLNGNPGTAMQPFKDQLSAAKIAAVITYQRNSWGNNNKAKYGKQAGGIVQPKTIAAAKAKEAP